MKGLKVVRGVRGFVWGTTGGIAIWPIMRLWVPLAGCALACCGGTAESDDKDGSGPIRVSPSLAGTDSKSEPSAGSAAGGSGSTAGSVSTGGDTSAGRGGSGIAGSSAAGSSDPGTAGTEQGGSSSGAAGAAGEAGAPPAPDDTGCFERPWSGYVGDLSDKVPVADCSSCSNGAELGYSPTPAFCAELRNGCSYITLTQLGVNDTFLLLPPAPSSAAAACGEQACADADGEPANFAGFVMQLALAVPNGAGPVRIETDPSRRIQRRDVPLFACDEPRSCNAFNGAAQYAIVVRPDAPRGWVRITVGAAATACK